MNSEEESQSSKCLHLTRGHEPSIKRNLLLYQGGAGRLNSLAHTCRHKEKKHWGLKEGSLHLTRKWSSRLEKGRQLLPQATQAQSREHFLRPVEKGFLNLNEDQASNLSLLLTHQNLCHHSITQISCILLQESTLKQKWPLNYAEPESPLHDSFLLSTTKISYT